MNYDYKICYRDAKFNFPNAPEEKITEAVELFIGVMEGKKKISETFNAEKIVKDIFNRLMFIARMES